MYQKKLNKNFVKIKINNIYCFVPQNLTILQACEYLNIEIPRFCYYKELNIAGNCRMCLIELENNPKPVASCALNILPNMSIFTNTPLVYKSRENILEFLLLNHPLDCPICDQGGECDLQDQSFLFGSKKSRFFFYKRSVEDKNCGPFIKTIMTRCIHCTRCIRFLTEIANETVLGTTFRGQNTEIGSYISKNIKTKLSGNLIDLCPVGALTSKPYAFKSRQWELKQHYNIDLFDSFSNKTIINTRGNKIMRVLPFKSIKNSIWLTDKARFFFDGLDIQRIHDVFINKQNSNWKNALNELNSSLLSNHNLIFILGKFLNLENIFLIKMLKQHFLNPNNMVLNEKFDKNINYNFLSNFIFKSNISNDLLEYDACLCINTNLQDENPILNSLLYQRMNRGNFEIYNLDVFNKENISTAHSGFSLKTLISLIEGRHDICKLLISKKNPIIIIGTTVLNQKNQKLINYLLSCLNKQFKILFDLNWNNLNHLHLDSNSMNSLFLNFNKKKKFKNKKKFILLNLDTDNVNFSLLEKELNIQFEKKIYIGSHVTKNTYESDIVIPKLSILEESGSYLNTQLKLQISEKLINNENKKIKPAWSIFCMLKQHHSFLFSNLNTSRYINIRKFLYKKYIFNKIQTSTHMIESTLKIKSKFFPNKKQQIFNQNIENYYLDDIITKNSSTMGSISYTLNKQNFLIN